MCEKDARPPRRRTSRSIAPGRSRHSKLIEACVDVAVEYFARVDASRRVHFPLTRARGVERASRAVQKERAPPRLLEKEGLETLRRTRVLSGHEQSEREQRPTESEDARLHLLAGAYLNTRRDRHHHTRDSRRRKKVVWSAVAFEGRARVLSRRAFGDVCEF